MARADDLIDDVTGEVIAELPVPLVVRINAGVPATSGRLVDPSLCGPFLRELLGLPRPAIELSAATFQRAFVPNMTVLAPAFHSSEAAETLARIDRLEREAARLRSRLTDRMA